MMEIRNELDNMYNETDLSNHDFDDYIKFKAMGKSDVLSHIGVINDDGSVEVVNCHYDGDIEKNGRKLVEYHNSVGLAKMVVRYGSIITLGKYSHYYKNRNKNDITVHRKYRKDMPMRFETVTHYVKAIKSDIVNIKYYYLFGNDKVFSKTWWVSSDGKEWKKVIKKLDNS